MSVVDIVKERISKTAKHKEDEAKRASYEKDVKLMESIYIWLDRFDSSILNPSSPEEEIADIIIKKKKLWMPCPPEWVSTWRGGDTVKIPEGVCGHIKKLEKKFDITITIEPEYREDWRREEPLYFAKGILISISL